MSKKCSKCKAVKELDLFGSNKSTDDGKNCYCKSCVKQVSLDRKWYHAEWRLKNKEHWNQKSREWSANNKERRKVIYTKALNESRSEVNARRREAYHTRGANHKKYAGSPDVRKAIYMRRRARLKGAYFEKYDPKEIFVRDKNKCVYCFKEAKELDHIVPLSRGGADAAWNLAACCIRCNRSKGAKTPEEWKSNQAS